MSSQTEIEPKRVHTTVDRQRSGKLPQENHTRKRKSGWPISIAIENRSTVPPHYVASK